MAVVFPELPLFAGAQEGTPGPANMALLATGARYGFRAALPFVLYATGDWVLMGFSLVVLAGLALAARTGLPRFYEQGRLLLNLGDVREGERVIYRGLPWNVETLSFYTTLVNPALTGGEVRLPLIQLPGMNSRPADRSEV